MIVSSILRLLVPEFGGFSGLSAKYIHGWDSPGLCRIGASGSKSYAFPDQRFAP
jgi:hypothetical protein